ncbi:MAG: SDR family NAD(P)-dependent oxidoreductase [Magnetococcales bacterium]|nr:SDR family NAD(P)-dependent oxidoreductase [Magnetococcales bacterium]
MKNVWNGFKMAFALILGWPFIVVLLPMWLLYSWNERRLGHPLPHAPWSGVRHAFGSRSPGEVESVNPLSRMESMLATRDETFQPAASVGHSGPVFASDVKSSADAIPWPVTTDPIPGGVALVTGGGKRLGAALCRDLARIGFKVGVVYHRDPDAARQIVEEILGQGGVARSFPLNLNDPGSVDVLLDEASQAMGGVPGLLVNNAGRFHPTRIDGGSWEEMDELFRVNLQGPLWLALRAGARMAAHGGGQIVNICDIWGERPLAGHAAYGASKAGMIMATQVLARDLAPRVRVNAIAPGAILPPEALSGPEAEAYQRLLTRTPLAAQAGPEAVTGALRYLLTAPYVTGEILRVDGGRRLV